MSREELIALVGEQAARIEVLEAKLARLEHLLSRNSGNSSMPPSKDDDPGRTPRPVKRHVVGRNVSGASSPARRGRIWPGSTGPMSGWTVSRRDDASAARPWPRPPIWGSWIAISNTTFRGCR
jgi:hypothetical protein